MLNETVISNMVNTNTNMFFSYLCVQEIFYIDSNAMYAVCPVLMQILTIRSVSEDIVVEID